VLVGPEAVPVVRKAGAALPDLAPEAHAETNIGGHGVLVVAAGDLPADGLLLHAVAGEGDAVAAVLRDAGAVPLDLATLDVLRIEDGRPWFGPDVKADNLLHETGLEAEYASFTKGCYVGQEVVARLQARGANVNKALRGLRLAAPAVAGASVQADGAEVGTVTTAGVSPSLGPIAMAMIRRSHLPPGSIVQVGNVPATVEALPLRAR
jgi:folate-binding protein YgfZ